MEFVYTQVANSITALIRPKAATVVSDRRQLRRSQRARYHVDLTTPATLFRSGPAGAITFPEPRSGTVDLCHVDCSPGIYAEVALRYGDTPEPTSEKPDDDFQAPGQRVRPNDPGPVPATAFNADQIAKAELLPGSTESSVSGNDGSVPVDSSPPVGSQVIREVVREEIQGYCWSAPLPPPDTLREYDEIHSGAAGRILAMAERYLTGKLDIEDKYATGIIEGAKLALRMASGLTILAFAASVVFFALTNQIAGLAFLSFPVALIIRSFLDRPDRNESAETGNT